MKKEFDLQLISKYRTPLMGVAMLWILLFHSPMKELELPFLLRFVKRTGFGGVDIFFLLSGLGIYFSYTKNSVKDFYKKRLLRILPYYIPIILLFGLVFQMPNDLVRWQGLLMRACIMDYWVKGIGLGWFIPVILLFYGVTPLVFKLINVEKTKWVMLACGLLVLIGWAVVQWGDQRMTNDIILRFADYILGIHLGYLIAQKKKIKLLPLVIGLVLAPTLMFANYQVFYTLDMGYSISYLTPFQSEFIAYSLRVVPFVLFALPACALFSTLFSKLPNYKYPMLSFVGSYTLCIYIFHERIITILEFYGAPSVALLAVSIAMVCAYLWQNFMDWLLKRLSC